MTSTSTSQVDNNSFDDSDYKIIESDDPRTWEGNKETLLPPDCLDNSLYLSLVDRFYDTVELIINLCGKYASAHKLARNFNNSETAFKVEQAFNKQWKNKSNQEKRRSLNQLIKSRYNDCIKIISEYNKLADEAGLPRITKAQRLIQILSDGEKVYVTSKRGNTKLVYQDARVREYFRKVIKKLRAESSIIGMQEIYLDFLTKEGSR